jgi:ABC-type transport system involved in cytochrome c biogenesis permease subunit
MENKIPAIVLALIIICLASATFIEKYCGTDFVQSHIYWSWWMCALWAILIISGIAHIISHRKSGNTFKAMIVLHLSMVLILIGSIVSMLTSKHGVMHLRMDEPCDVFVANENGKMVTYKIPMEITLTSFKVKYNSGTDSPSNYVSEFTVKMPEGETNEDSVSMNHIFITKNIRLNQTSYDNDMRGSLLTVNMDFWGILVTYMGYALLFVSFLWVLFSKKGKFRRLLHSQLLKSGTITAVLLVLGITSGKAATVLPDSINASMERLLVLWNGRICPMRTMAIDLTKKLTGEDHYREYSAMQVLSGFVLNEKEWNAEPVVKVKSEEIRRMLGLRKYASVNDFFNQGNGYILGPFIEEFYNGNQDELHKAAANLDDRLQLVMSVEHGDKLALFPIMNKGEVKWYAPTLELPMMEDSLQWAFVKNVITMLCGTVAEKNYAETEYIIKKIAEYQVKEGGGSVPSEFRINAEIFVDEMPFTDILYRTNLIIGLLMVIIVILNYSSRHPIGSAMCSTFVFCYAVLYLSFLMLTIFLVLRWIVSGNIPLGNGYDTMLVVAWLVMLIAIIVYHKIKITLPFGFLLSGFPLLVASIGMADPQITLLAPVLSSPLLGVHVTLIMISFALLSFTFICGLTALAMRKNAIPEKLQVVSQLFLLLGIAFLGIGIFVGAIWANESWGKYWSWDPKEVWALITFLVYALGLHSEFLPWLRKPMHYHIYVALAFITILMTYFGVNYYLGGMHSYAG